jgi:hypothetical protein
MRRASCSATRVSSISQASLPPYVTPLGQKRCAQKVAATMEPRKTSDVLMTDSFLMSLAPPREDDLEEEDELDGERRREERWRRLRLREWGGGVGGGEWYVGIVSVGDGDQVRFGRKWLCAVFSVARAGGFSYRAISAGGLSIIRRESWDN